MKKNIIIALCLLVVIAFGILLYVIFKDNFKKKFNIPEDEQIQVRVLKEIYTQFLENEIPSDAIVTLDESCFKNLATGEKFSDENVSILSALTDNYKGGTTNYILYLDYNNSKGSLTLNLKEVSTPDNPHCVYECYITYELELKNNTLTFTRNNLVQELFSLEI